MQAKFLLDLRTLLADEKAALLGARYDALQSLSDAKAELLLQLSDHSLARETLEELQTAINTNQKLLSAAIKGVGAAKERLTALQDVRTGLSVYDQNGAMNVKSTARSTIEKKA